MIIDSHVHVLSESLRARRDEIAGADPWFAMCHEGERRIATVDELLAEMDASGIDRAMCFGWPFADSTLCAESNDHLALVQEQHPDRIVAFGTINPVSRDAVRELRRCADLGLRGVGELNSDAQAFELSDERVGAAVEVSIALGLPWVLHCSEPVGHAYAGKGTATPDRIASFAVAHPELQLICAHLGGGLPFYAHMPEVAQLCRRLWFDTAAAPFLYEPSAYRTVADLVGADRLLFGSDYPLLRRSRYDAALDAAALDARDRALVMGGNAEALLNLSS